ncbi:GDSL-type esterase/lipase family protein [uncultured Selenomonas sp.]|uniref:GDSL-type esterase/lipase family protein n=1 Tax=uncultured Selenomonas sp. TaxID=159275 RepID=UPI0028DB137B|nr:GDSL-type esterase/lipase family protein [uncultured Selenomonas sp.]
MQSRYRCFWKRGAVLALCLAAAALSPVGADSAEAAATLGDVHKVYAAATKDRTVMLEREAAQKEVEDPVKTDGGRGAGATAEAPGSVKPPEPLNPGAKGAERILPQKLRFLWKPVADAVRYEIVVEEGTGEKAKVVYRDTHVFNNGVEIALKGRSWLDANHYWRVRALDYDGNERAPFTPPVAVELAEKDPAAPLPTSEFMKMDYVPLYPTYSWVAVLGAAEYEVAVWKRGRFEPALLHMLYSTDLTCYDTYGFTTPGAYYWKVRALDKARQPISDWSENVPFEVKSPVVVAALGDSITHGGGAVVNGPDRVRYDWQTYAAFPIKNLGYSGDTVEAMEARFERDVLPFRPKILVIMGGVNNYRVGGKAADIIAVLARIRDKCTAHKITPVFATVTSLNPAKIAKLQYAQNPPAGWSDEQALVNRWILSQPYCVDVTTILSDGEGKLEDIYTTDGLHPDSAAKRFIGETISNYLRARFPQVVEPLLREPKL